jgi:membrane-associated phospholipid phosphatase
VVPAGGMAELESLAPVDRWTLAYTALATLALALHWPVRSPYAGLLPLAHVGLIVAALVAPRARRAGALGRFLGTVYPLAVVSVLYSEIGLLNLSAGYCYDATIQAWEGRVFGLQPSYEWIRAWPWPWFSYPLHVGYLSYYAIVAVPPLALWFSGRRQSAERAVLFVAVTFYVCYAIFLAFPVAGPRYTFPLAANPATAILPAVLAQRLLNAGAAWGTAFPSSHVAVALVSSLQAGRGWRALGWIFIPLAVLLTFGTVYGQFHYALDALAGALLAGAVLVWDRRHSPTAASLPGQGPR